MHSSYDMAFPLLSIIYRHTLLQRYGLYYDAPNNTAPHRTATGLWAPGPAHGTHGIVRRPPQYPNSKNYILHFVTTISGDMTLHRF